MSGEKRYSIFVSSTWEDLQKERAAAYEAILSNGGIPIGMEQFPAGLSIVSLIESMIDQCDYLVVITKATYGSIEPISKLSYTELEVRYALQKGIPILPFVVRTEKLTRGETDKIPNFEKLEKFHRFLKNTLGITCNFFDSSEDLRSAVTTSLNKAYGLIPRPGYSRGTALTPRGKLEGVWELPSDPKAGPGERAFKIYGESNYLYVRYRVVDGLAVQLHGGAYELDGDKYRETILFTSPKAWASRGYTTTFKCDLVGSNFHIKSKSVDQHWSRSELANDSQSGSSFSNS